MYDLTLPPYCFLGPYKSVVLRSKTSAAMAKVCESVGAGTLSGDVRRVGCHLDVVRRHGDQFNGVYLLCSAVRGLGRAGTATLAVHR